MRPASILPIVILFLSLFCPFRSRAQCPAAAPAVPCTGTEPLVAADEILTDGTTKWYYGSATTLNSLTLRGGQLIVCGDLTIDKFYMDSGQIIINEGARFVIGSGLGEGLILRGDCAIYNYGTFEVQRNLSFDNGWATPATPNIIVNALYTSVFRMPNQYFVINNANSWFVNNGSSQFWGIITDNQSSPGSVCLGPGSTVRMAILINKVTNTYRVSSGNACVYVFQFSEFFGALTNSPSLFACLAAGHTSNSGCIPFGCQPNDWGSAQVFTNCNSCASLGVLPIRFISFILTENSHRNILKWQLDLGASGYKFYVERSSDGKFFYMLDSLYGNAARDFSYIDGAVLPGQNYYRVRCIELQTGRSIASRIISSFSDRQSGSRIYPSPFSHSFFIIPPGGVSPDMISVLDIAGNNIPIRWRQEGTQWRVILQGIYSQQVLLVRVVANNRVEWQKILYNGL